MYTYIYINIFISVYVHVFAYICIYTYIYIYFYVDGDGKPDYLDVDSDNDGINDALEGIDDVDGLLALSPYLSLSFSNFDSQFG